MLLDDADYSVIYKSQIWRWILLGPPCHQKLTSAFKLSLDEDPNVEAHMSR